LLWIEPNSLHATASPPHSLHDAASNRAPAKPIEDHLPARRPGRRGSGADDATTVAVAPLVRVRQLPAPARHQASKVRASPSMGSPTSLNHSSSSIADLHILTIPIHYLPSSSPVL
jgi:hypothetical protein